MYLSGLNFSLMEDYQSRQHKLQRSSSTTRLTGSPVVNTRHENPATVACWLLPFNYTVTPFQ